MADKPQKTKKPKHARLVLPGDKPRAAPKDTDRLGRTLPAEAGLPTAAGSAKSAVPAADAASGKPTEAAGQTLPANAIALPAPKKNKRKASPARRRRRRRRIGLAALVLAIALGLFVYQTGLHQNVMNSLAEWTESMQIASRPGNGFPMPLSVTGFVRAEEMPAGGFVVLGKQDMAIVSDTGAELRRVQHSYLSPGVSAGAARAVLYSRGGREYTIEGRSNTVAKHNTTQDIAFAHMSRGGWLALATTSRFSSRLMIMDNTYNNMQPQLEYDIRSGETPFMAAFMGDDHNLALASISSSGGVMGTTFTLLRVGTASVISSFRVEGVIPLQVEYLSQNRILAVFDTYAALYDNQGEQLAKYEYSGRSLYAADTQDGRVALVFGSAAQETVRAVLLNTALEPQFDVSFASGGIARALLCEEGMYLLAGQEVLALDNTGAAAARLALAYKPLGLTRGAGPLAVTAGRVEDLNPLFNPPEEESDA